jgi:hypothetical protein
MFRLALFTCLFFVSASECKLDSTSAEIISRVLGSESSTLEHLSLAGLRWIVRLHADVIRPQS